MAPETSVKVLIQNVSVLVHNRGFEFESMLKQRVPKTDPNWSFLLMDGSPSNLYYRWCLLVLGNNETFSSYSLLPFSFFANDAWYLPPPVYDEQSEKQRLDSKMESLNRSKRLNGDQDGDEEGEMPAKRRKMEDGYGWRLIVSSRSNLMLESVSIQLDASLFDWLCSALRSITPQRMSILRVMAFCMDNAAFAEHIVCILRDSICDNVPYLELVQKENDCGPVVRIARLYVVNDLLYNADNGVTTSYRILIQVHFRIAIERVERASFDDRGHFACSKRVQIPDREEGDSNQSD